MTAATKAADDAAAGTVLPPIRYQAAILPDELFDRLHHDSRFAQLAKDNLGSPIELRIYQTFAPTSGGKAAGVASSLLAAGTLGILPLVYNGDMSVTYDIVVNGTVLSSYVYSKNFTRTHNVYAHNNTHQGLDEAGVAWVESTVDQFIADSANDEKLAALIAEYRFYFGDDPSK